MPSMSSAQVLRSVRLFEAYARNAWPLHRRLVASRLARRCTGCAASERMLPLGPTGRCQRCEAQVPPVKARNDGEVAALERLLDEHQGSGRGLYDALVPFSGGKDSTYLVERVRREFPRLRLLAYTLDNGFMSPLAKENLEALLPRLEVDHLFVRPRAGFYRTLFRHALTHLNARGCYGTVDFSDGEFMLDTARRLAAERAIPLILCGYSRYQVEDGLNQSGFESPRARELADRTETAGLPLADIFGPEERALWWHGSQWPQERVARLLFPLYAWDLEETTVRAQVEAWGLFPARQHSPAATNHQLIPLLGVVDVHRLGYSSFEPEFCRMIRDGKADRVAWQRTFELLEYSARTGLFVRGIVEELLARLDLTTADVGVQFQT